MAVRASRKLRNDELLVTGFAATRLRLELDQIPLWRGNHVAIKQLVEDFARYVSLPRLKEPAVLLGAIRDGLGLLMWQQDAFAYADGATGTPPAPFPKPKRFHGSVPLDPARVGRDARRIADEILAHLVGLVGSTVKVTLEIEAE